ncbi:MAG: VOC family protein [Alphaproteobacteria bacterium]|nr:VOC family protein [Alphaproteobacteria bacterium]MBU0796077.1 VOC family protein [Alphaproteobacteria bacterium]MBU0885772.1 VOC family protein [Alphaproteobacteria bacterium]MBU1814475.1 VOC family protein [Alphaproteobacteria bacterium]
MAPRLSGIIETALYVQSLDVARAFYETILGLEALHADERMCALDVAGRSVLLLFPIGGALEPVDLPDGSIPPHDASGHQHIAFAITADELPQWESHLQKHDIAIEGRAAWPRGGRSLFFRDPDGHLLEVATPGLWTTY